MDAPAGELGPAALLAQLRRRDIVVWAEDGRLRFEAPRGALTEELRAQVRRRRAELLDFLATVDVARREQLLIPVRDGVRLAADLFLPRDPAGPTPVVWSMERYHRAEVAGTGERVTKLDQQPWLRELVRHGYAVAVVDARGTGGSAGERATEFGAEERADGFDVTEWLAAQLWSTGRVGMYGESYSAVAALLTAATAPPHLRAIFPQMALFDVYEFLYPGGVFRADFARRWGELVHGLDVAAALDGERSQRRRLFDLVDELSYRDDIDPMSGVAPYRELSPSSLVERISASGVAVLHVSGWYDLWVRDTLLWWRNLRNPQEVIIGGWSHNGREGLDLGAEHVRWFDRWLREEPPLNQRTSLPGMIRYFTMSAPPGRQWRTTRQWPPVGSRPVTLRLAAGPTGTATSCNDGRLVPTVETLASDTAAATVADRYRIDYAATTGRSSRWSDGYGGGFRYDLTPNDARTLTYTTDPLPVDIEVTGDPIARLWVSASCEDIDVVVLLEEIDLQGASHYVSEGVLRASHRACTAAPWDQGELPYHPGLRATTEPLVSGGAPVELVIALLPTSTVLPAGRRLRLCIAGADADNLATLQRRPAPVLTVHRGATTPSQLLLPLVPVDAVAWPVSDPCL